MSLFDYAVINTRGGLGVFRSCSRRKVGDIKSLSAVKYFGAIPNFRSDCNTRRTSIKKTGRKGQNQWLGAFGGRRGGGGWRGVSGSSLELMKPPNPVVRSSFLFFTRRDRGERQLFNQIGGFQRYKSDSQSQKLLIWNQLTFTPFRSGSWCLSHILGSLLKSVLGLFGH